MNEYSLIKEIGLPTTLIGLTGFALLLFFIYLVVKLINPKSEGHEPIIIGIEPKHRFILAIVVLVISASLIVFSISSISSIESLKMKNPNSDSLNNQNKKITKDTTNNKPDTVGAETIPFKNIKRK